MLWEDTQSVLERQSTKTVKRKSRKTLHNNTSIHREDKLFKHNLKDGKQMTTKKNDPRNDCRE